MLYALPIQWISRYRERGYFNQLFMALLVPAINFGMLMGWLSPMAAVLQSPDGPAPEPLSDKTISWMIAVNFIPSVVGGVPTGHVADKLGRKFVSMITAFLLIVGWSIMLISLDPWALITSRFISGFAGAGCYVVTPLYLKEIASDDIRGAIGSLFILSLNMGYLLIYIVGDLLSFWAVLWICIAVPAAFMFVFIFMPETPVFLIRQGKIQKAREALAFLQNTTTDNKNLDEAIKQLEREEDEAKSMKAASWKSLVQDKTTFKAFRLSATLMVGQETCGYLIVLMNAGSIFARASESIDLELSPNKQTIVVGAIQVLGSIVASGIVEKTGRKWLLTGTAFATGLSMLALGLWFYITSMDIWLPGWLPVAAMCMCIFSDAAGLQPVPYVIMSEMFSFQHRGMVTSFVVSICAISDFAQTKAYDPISKILGIHWVFIIFSIVCFLVALFTIIFVPETINKTVEEIYAILEGNNIREENIENAKKGTIEEKKEISYL